jgi:hypothetical protein
MTSSKTITSAVKEVALLNPRNHAIMIQPLYLRRKKTTTVLKQVKVYFMSLV